MSKKENKKLKQAKKTKKLKKKTIKDQKILIIMHRLEKIKN